MFLGKASSNPRYWCIHNINLKKYNVKNNLMIIYSIKKKIYTSKLTFELIIIQAMLGAQYDIIK